MTCPVSSSAFHCVNKHIFGDSSFHIFEDRDDSTSELGMLIEVDKPTEATVRLRCFFAIECAVYVALRAAFASLDNPELAVRFGAALPIERSHEGLTRFLLVMEDIEKSLRVDQLEYAFMGDHNNELGGFNARLLEKPKTIVSNITRMARVLRPDLCGGVYGGVSGAAEIGDLMARTLVDTFPDPETCFFWIRRLFNTTLENPSSWKRESDD